MWCSPFGRSSVRSGCPLASHSWMTKMIMPSISATICFSHRIDDCDLPNSKQRGIGRSGWAVGLGVRTRPDRQAWLPGRVVRSGAVGSGGRIRWLHVSVCRVGRSGRAFESGGQVARLGWAVGAAGSGGWFRRSGRLVGWSGQAGLSSRAAGFGGRVGRLGRAVGLGWAVESGGRVGRLGRAVWTAGSGGQAGLSVRAVGLGVRAGRSSRAVESGGQGGRSDRAFSVSPQCHATLKNTKQRRKTPQQATANRSQTTALSWRDHGPEIPNPQQMDQMQANDAHVRGVWPA